MMKVLYCALCIDYCGVRLYYMNEPLNHHHDDDSQVHS